VQDLSIFQITGFSAVAVLVIGWLAVSFLPAGAARTRTAWLAATAMYVAFLSLFSSLLLGAREADSLLGTLGFGFLTALFAAGLLVSLARTIRSLAASPGRPSEHAAH
jgi:O-antigen ligase